LAQAGQAGKELRNDTMSTLIQAELPELTDVIVGKGALQGDAAAFERIYRLHSQKVYTLCLRMVGDAAQAENLTQDVFLQLFRKIAAFRARQAKN
jgi:DNA-directed RNA polymerase specialized sigma24 family protein